MRRSTVTNTFKAKAALTLAFLKCLPGTRRLLSGPAGLLMLRGRTHIFRGLNPPISMLPEKRRTQPARQRPAGCVSQHPTCMTYVSRWLSETITIGLTWSMCWVDRNHLKYCPHDTLVKLVKLFRTIVFCKLTKVVISTISKRFYFFYLVFLVYK